MSNFSKPNEIFTANKNLENVTQNDKKQLSEIIKSKSEKIIFETDKHPESE